MQDASRGTALYDGRRGCGVGRRMVKSALMYLVPCVLTLVLAGGIRAAAGPERGARLAGAAVDLAFVASWGFFLRPGWIPTDDFSRVGHIAVGAVLMGLALDILAPKRF